MEKKKTYTPPLMETVETEMGTNILSGSEIGTGGSNNVEISDEIYVGEFRSNKSLWDL